jgi:hypothetical protein
MSGGLPFRARLPGGPAGDPPGPGAPDIVIDAETVQLVRAAVQAAFWANAPSRPAPTPARSRPTAAI